jgi:hypothetical protein
LATATGRNSSLGTIAFDASKVKSFCKLFKGSISE